MDMEGETLRYLSKRFILVGTKLGCATQYVPEIIKENLPIVKQFRELYKPYEIQYEVKYKNPTMGNSNIFSNPSATQDQIEEFLVKGCHKIEWTEYNKIKNTKTERKEEIKITFLR